MSTSRAVEFEYPSWWSSATTVRVDTVTNGSATFPVGDVELFAYGVALPSNSDNPSEVWIASVHPWSQIVNIHKVT